MNNTVTNEQIIQAVFSATPEAKQKALAILEGEELPETTDGPLLLTMGQTCELLGVSRATAWRMARSGRLTKTEIYPGAFRVKRQAVLDIVNGKAVSHG